MSLWGNLEARYSVNRPRKLLALDGGGIRGVLTLEILRSIESQLADRTGEGDQFRLCNFFDYIAGTSTGAIIAAGLARGMSVSELLRFYREKGKAMFDSRSLLSRWKSLYDSNPLALELQETFGAGATLEPQHLKCLLLVVTRNVSTDSPWPISSNPLAKYNDPGRPDCNLRIPLWRLVRASTAAPIYFPPESIQWDPSDPSKSFVFVDGGVTPYNNPSFLLYRMATIPEYRLGWQTGERNLMLISVGSGLGAQDGASVSAPEVSLASNLAGLPGVLIVGSQVDQDVNCRAIGRCVYGEQIDREIGDLIPRRGGQAIPVSEDLGRRFLYAGYNADLSREGLSRLGLSDVDSSVVQKLDSVDAMDDLQRIGRAVARDVWMGDFEPFLSKGEAS